MTATGNELVTLNQLKLYGGGILRLMKLISTATK